MDMLYYEREYAHLGLICGVDEAGAGPLAGPVAAAAVIMPAGLILDGVDDSKKLSEKKRKALQGLILEAAVTFCVVFMNHVKIDEINILRARLLAMTGAVAGLDPGADFALIDGTYALEGISGVPIKKGDARSHSIACASILAKVARDEVMVDYHKQYPEYGFDRHKGYPTKAHYAAIAAHGPCPIHRRSFLRGLHHV